MKAKEVKRCVLVFVVVALVLTLACAKVETPEPPKAMPKAPVTIHLIAPLSGVMSALVGRWWEGVQACVQYINNEGGLDGHEVKLQWGDDEYNPAKNVSLYKEWKAQNPIVYILFSSPGGEALKRLFEEDKVGCVNGGVSMAQIYPPATIYLAQPTYEAQVVAAIEYFKKNWRQARAPRIASIGNEYGYSLSVIEIGKRLSAALGMEWVEGVIVPAQPVTTAKELSRLRDAGVDALYLTGTSPSAAVVVKEWREMGLDKQFQILAWFGVPADIMATISKDVYGFYYTCLSPVEADAGTSPDVKKILDFYKSKNLTFSTHSLVGWAEIELACRAVKLAGKAVGYEKLTGQAVIEQGLKKMQGQDLLVYPPLEPSGNIVNTYVRLLYAPGPPNLGKAEAPLPWWKVGDLPMTADWKPDWDVYKTRAPLFIK